MGSWFYQRVLTSVKHDLIFRTATNRTNGKWTQIGTIDPERNNNDSDATPAPAPPLNIDAKKWYSQISYFIWIEVNNECLQNWVTATSVNNIKRSAEQCHIHIPFKIGARWLTIEFISLLFRRLFHCVWDWIYWVDPAVSVSIWHTGAGAGVYIVLNTRCKWGGVSVQFITPL